MSTPVLSTLIQSEESVDNAEGAGDGEHSTSDTSSRHPTVTAERTVLGERKELRVLLLELHNATTTTR